jgi:hypothetical protein
MSIFCKDGVGGEIRTTTLPSGDVAVSCPTDGPLNQIVFNICRWDGRNNPAYGGWIVPKARAWKVRRDLEAQCRKLAD